MAKPGRPAVNSSAAHVFDVLRAIGEAEEPPGVSELGRQLGLPPSTTFRALTTLEAAGYISRLRNVPRFELGTMPALLKRALLRRFPLRDASRPFLRRLAAELGETSSLSIRLGWYSIRLAGAYGNQDVYHRARLGELNLLHESLAGRAMLSVLPDLAGYRSFVKRHHPDRKPPVKLDESGDTGFVREAVAGAGGLSAVALAVRDASGRPLASIAVSGPVYQPGAAAPWERVRSELEQVVRSDPVRFKSPFAHIPDDDICLRLNG